MSTMSTFSDDTSGRPTKSFVRFLPPLARILMGLVFFVFGLNGFLHFIPQPPTVPDFAIALAKTGYMLPIIFATQLIVGVLLLVNRFVPLALVLIAPVIVNIVAFHLFLAPSGIPMAIIVLLLEIYLVWAYRKAYAPLFTARATPGM